MALAGSSHAFAQLVFSDSEANYNLQNIRRLFSAQCSPTLTTIWGTINRP